MLTVLSLGQPYRTCNLVITAEKKFGINLVKMREDSYSLVCIFLIMPVSTLRRTKI